MKQEGTILPFLVAALLSEHVRMSSGALLQPHAQKTQLLDDVPAPARPGGHPGAALLSALCSNSLCFPSPTLPRFVFQGPLAPQPSRHKHHSSRLLLTLALPLSLHSCVASHWSWLTLHAFWGLLPAGPGTAGQFRPVQTSELSCHPFLLLLCQLQQGLNVSLGEVGPPSKFVLPWLVSFSPVVPRRLSYILHLIIYILISCLNYYMASVS